LNVELTVAHDPRTVTLLLHAALKLRKVLFLAPSVFFLFVYEISRERAERIPAKVTRKRCLVPRSDEFEGQGQRSRLPGTKTAFFGPFRRPACGLCLL